MNLNYILKRKHIFKNRKNKHFFKNIKFRLGTIAAISIKHQRFELVYLRILKKIIRRKHIKTRMLFRRRRY